MRFFDKGFCCNYLGIWVMIEKYLYIRIPDMLIVLIILYCHYCVRETKSEREKRVYVERYNPMLADRQKGITNEKEFVA